MTSVDRHGPHCEATITCHVIGRRTVVAVQGEIDLDTAPALVAAIDQALSDGAAELWIDLTETEFMDSSGLHALLDAQRRTSEINRRLAVICPGGAVRRLFEIAGVLGHMPLFDDRATAHRVA